MKQLTKAQIENDYDFSGKLKLPLGYELYTMYPGGSYLWYYFFTPDNIILFSGKDFKPSTLYNIDDLQSVVCLLGFLTTMLGDTDDDYFKDYTHAQIDFINSSDCHELHLLVYDFENKDGGKSHKQAKKYLKANYHQ